MKPILYGWYKNTRFNPQATKKTALRLPATVTCWKRGTSRGEGADIHLRGGSHKDKIRDEVVYLGGDVDKWARDRESGRADNTTLVRLLRLPWCFLSEDDRLTVSSGSEMTLQSSLAAPTAESSDDLVVGRSTHLGNESESRRTLACNFSVSVSSSPVF